MSPQSIYDKLMFLCDEYDSLQEKIQLAVEEFNSSDDEGERDNLKKDLSDLNDIR